MQLAPPQTTPRGLTILIRLATAALLIAMLSIGSHVLVPIAIAFMLAFILTTPLKWFIKLGIPRRLSLTLVMLLSLAAVTGFSAFLAIQVDELADRLATYSESMRKRVLALQLGEAGPWGKLETTLERVTTGLERVGPQMATVRTVPAEESSLDRLKTSVAPLAIPIAGVVVVFVLCLFFLSQREDLRNRLIRLAGPRNLTLTTRTLDDAGHRISQYLVAQTVINAALGALIALGLYLIGVPYAALWGAFVAVLRFVPYIGSMAAALMPAALAFAIFPGWREVMLTVLLFLALDVVTAYFVEPMLIGQRTGVTAIALLVSTLFWSWLWGPIGLVLATPLTVSLAVLGRHLPSLRFLSIVLGDEAVLGPETTYYQRLLARDEDEASEINQKAAQSLGPLGVIDQVLLPALVLAARDRDRGEITDVDIGHVLAATSENVSLLRDRTSEASPRTSARAKVIGLSTGPESLVLLEMIAVALPHALGPFEIVSSKTDLRDVAARSPAMVVLAALPPHGGTPARELCRKVREQFPALPLLVLRPDETPADAARAAARFRTAGAELVVATVADAVAALGGPAALKPAVQEAHQPMAQDDGVPSAG